MSGTRIFTAGAALFCLLSLTSCEEAAPPQTSAALPVVTTASPVVTTIRDWDSFVGQFEAVEHVEIRPRLSGYLVEVAFADGSVVEQDDLLFRIDPRPFESRVNEARSRMQSVETRLSNATTELERARGLLDIQAVSQEEFDALEAEVNTVRSDLEAARAAMQTAELDVEFTRINSPISGRASYRRVDTGNIVRADETLLTSVISVDPIHFTFQGSEALYLKYKREHPEGLAGAPVQIRLQDEETAMHEGQLEFFDNAISTGSGTIRGRAVVPNPDGFLVPGMFGHLQLQATDDYEGILLPDSAIVTRGAQRIVYTVDSSGLVTSHQVELGPLYQGLRVIREGLGGTEQVIISGVQRAIPGSPVEAVPGSIALPDQP